MRKFIFPLYVTMMTCVASTSLHASGEEKVEAAHSSTAHLAPLPLDRYKELATQIKVDLDTFKEKFSERQAAATAECSTWAHFLQLDNTIREEGIRSAIDAAKKKDLEDKLDVTKLAELSAAAYEASIPASEEFRGPISALEEWGEYNEALLVLKALKNSLTEEKHAELAAMLPADDALSIPAPVSHEPSQTHRDAYEARQGAFYSELEEQLKGVLGGDAAERDAVITGVPSMEMRNIAQGQWRSRYQQKLITGTSLREAKGGYEMTLASIEDCTRKILRGASKT